MTDHEKKYEALAQKIGIPALVYVLKCYNFPTPEEMRERANADPHLNNIPLAKWDRAAGLIARPWWADSIKLNFYAPFTPNVANGLSLAERVCVLKHVAVFHYALKVLDNPLPM